MSRKRVPTEALRFRAPAEFLFAAGEITPGKPIPVHIVARTDQPVDHWYWGRVVHDLAGMRLTKPTIPIDYMHDPREVLGFASKFSTEGALSADGALVPIRPDDRATEIATKQRAGVPYEASIDFASESGIKIEQLAEGQVAQVNGYTLEGPAAIIREWPLRGIAICPYGVDAATSAQFSAGTPPETVVEITKGKTMPEEKPQQPTPTEPQEKPEEKPAEPEKPAGKPEEKPAETSTEKPPADATSLSAADPRAEFRRFAAVFGDKAGQYYAEGKSFEDALAQFAKDQKARADDLEKRLAAVERGETQKLSAGHASEEKPEEKPKQGDPAKFAALGTGTAKLAAGMKLAK